MHDPSYPSMKEITVFPQTTKLAAVAFLCLIVVLPALSQGKLDTVQIRTQKVGEGIFMLTGAGGNIGVSSGPDGIFLIDDQFAPLTEKITKAVAEATQSNAPVRFVLNTHWHGDHTGGNENMGVAGAVIVAQENVRKRMSVEQFNEMFNRKTPASPANALPIVTFEDELTFYLNGDEIRAFHVKNAHTDGDVIVHFKKANVLHMGDVFFSGTYPIIDISSGGSIDGMISALTRVLPFVNEGTRIIPGHGPLSRKYDLKVYREMLTGVRVLMQRQIAEKKTLDQVKAANPLRDYDARWAKGSVKPEQFLEMVYKSLRK